MTPDASPCANLIVEGVSSIQLSQFELMAQYAGAAYCWSNVDGRATRVTCQYDNGSCVRVESSNNTILKSFIKYVRYSKQPGSVYINIPSAGYSQTAGYVTLDDFNGLIIVAIRGTATDTNPIDFFTGRYPL